MGTNTAHRWALAWARAARQYRPTNPQRRARAIARHKLACQRAIANR